MASAQIAATGTSESRQNAGKTHDHLVSRSGANWLNCALSNARGPSAGGISGSRVRWWKRTNPAVALKLLFARARHVRHEARCASTSSAGRSGGKFAVGCQKQVLIR